MYYRACERSGKRSGVGDRGEWVSEKRGGAEWSDGSVERKVAERERSGVWTKSAAPATAPADILLFRLHVTQIDQSYSNTLLL